MQGSIRRRLLVSLLAGAAALAVLLYFAVQSVARQVAQESQDNVLAASARAILDSARVRDGQVTVDLPYSALSMLDSITDERVFYVILLNDEVLSGYSDLPVTQTQPVGRVAYGSASYAGADIRIANVRRTVSTDMGQAMLHVAVAQTLSGQQQMLARISQRSVGIGGGFFLLSVLLAALVARSTIQPLDRLTASVSRRGPKDLRPVAAPVPSEMVPLVTSLNSFMNRLQTSLSRSEDFITEAAHRVRTPLALVRTKAEIQQRQADDPDNRAALGEMIHAIDDASRTAGQLLDHAMVTFRLDDMARERIDLGALAQDMVQRLSPLSDLKEIDVRATHLDPVEMSGDPILLQNALHNILDNAIKYAPKGARVSLSLQKADQQAELRIHDTGPGFPQNDLALLTQRFERGTNAAGVVGSGLGLTIARDVVEAHGGWLEINNPDGGGACVSLFFPLS